MPQILLLLVVVPQLLLGAQHGWDSLHQASRYSAYKCTAGLFSFLNSTTSIVLFHVSSTYTADGCTSGELRLGDGKTINEGRLEYCHNGTWSPFCSIEHNVATVACRQLGYRHYTCELEPFDLYNRNGEVNVCHRGQDIHRWKVWRWSQVQPVSVLQVQQ